MSERIKEIAELDKLVHESSRLAILTALSACEKADFLYLQSVTGLTRGNLSSHLAKLEQGGLIAIEKSFVGKKPNTMVSLTEAGRGAIEGHWEKLRKLGNEEGQTPIPPHTREWRKGGEGRDAG